jgi:hypothetical protein
VDLGVLEDLARLGQGLGGSYVRGRAGVRDIPSGLRRLACSHDFLYPELPANTERATATLLAG